MRTRLIKILFPIFFLLISNDCFAKSAKKTKSRQESVGIASYYNNNFHGHRTASGEVYNKNQLTAAHRTFAFGTLLEVVNLKNGQKVTVKVNDRGPYIKGRLIDLSMKAAKKLGIFRKGIGKVRIKKIS